MPKDFSTMDRIDDFSHSKPTTQNGRKSNYPTRNERIANRPSPPSASSSLASLQAERSGIESNEYPPKAFAADLMRCAKAKNADLQS